jgi:glycolate oxidase subunit GlcD
MANVPHKLKDAVGEGHLLSDPDELRVYECDGLPQHKSLPGGVAILRSTDDVAEVVRVLSEGKIPFLARGSGTGLSGGALALGGTFIIELARLDRILSIDPVDRLARVEVGVLNAEVSRHASSFGLYYSPDPSSQNACTIGGNIAENAGGIHCLRNGVTVDHVAEITVVLSDGEIVELHDVSMRPGFDLAGVFVGSEGTFGIATRATLRLIQRLPHVATLLAAFESIRDGSVAVSEIIGSGILPAALEMMDAVAIRAVEAGVYKAGLPLDAGAALIIEVEGLDVSVSAESAIIEAICRGNGAMSFVSATDDEHRTRIWKARKGAFGAMGRLSPDVMIQDAVVPRSRLPEVLEGIHEIASKYDLTVANVFHAGDGNLHPLVPFDSSDPAAVKRVKDAGQEMMRVCIDAGGAITGEHGVGIDKIDHLGLMYSADDLEAMFKVREAFDPLGLCNPGKAIPILRGCGEARAVAHPTPNARVAADEPPTSPGKAPGASSRLTGSAFCLEEARTKFSSLVDPENVRLGVGSLIVEPGTYEEISNCLRLSTAEGWTTMPVGASNWTDAGEPAAAANILLSTARLRSVLRHEPADLVATVHSGKLLSELNSELGAQWLPLDPPFYSRSTLGGVVATGLAGPLSTGFGRPRSRVLGIKAALADGTIIKAGGSVVKNVAGYDLGKLFTGSFGTLAVILEVSLRLCAAPDIDRTLVVLGPNPMVLQEAALEIRNKGIQASAAAIVSTSLVGLTDFNCEHVLLLRFMGREEGVAAQVANVRHASPVEAESAGDELWRKLSASEDQLMWRIATLPSRVADLTGAIIDRTTEVKLHVDPYQGWIRCLGAEASLNGRGLCELRNLATATDGSLVIDRAPSRLKAELGAWGELGSAATIMSRIKSRLDPNNLLSPGRFDLVRG